MLALSGGGGDSPSTSDNTRVTLTWDSPNDLDLIVEDPCGNCIWFQAPQATCNGSSGELTRSANAQSAQSNPTEIVDFALGGAEGAYNVFVTDTLNRNGEATAFTVDVLNQGATAKATGSVEPNAMTPVSTFTHSTGVAP